MPSSTAFAFSTARQSLGGGGGGVERGLGGRADLPHEGFVGVAELAEVQQGLHHGLLQGLLCLFLTVLVPVDVPP